SIRVHHLPPECDAVLMQVADHVVQDLESDNTSGAGTSQERLTSAVLIALDTAQISCGVASFPCVTRACYKLVELPPISKPPNWSPKSARNRLQIGPPAPVFEMREMPQVHNTL